MPEVVHQTPEAVHQMPELVVHHKAEAARQSLREAQGGREAVPRRGQAAREPVRRVDWVEAEPHQQSLCP